MADFESVPRTLRTRGMRIAGDGRPGQQVVASCGIHTLRFTPMYWTGPGQALARTTLGVLTYVRRIGTDTESVRDVLADLGSCRLLIGITGSAGSLSHTSCLDSVYAIATGLDGLIFDGATVRAANGAALVSPP